MAVDNVRAEPADYVSYLAIAMPVPDGLRCDTNAWLPGDRFVVNRVLLDDIAVLPQKIRFSKVDLVLATGLLIKVMDLKNFQRESNIRRGITRNLRLLCEGVDE